MGAARGLRGVRSVKEAELAGMDDGSALLHNVLISHRMNDELNGAGASLFQARYTH